MDIGLLSGLAEGVKSGIQGYSDAKDRKQKEIEFTAKKEADKIQQNRQKMLDEITLQEKGYDVQPGQDIYAGNLQRTGGLFSPREQAEMRFQAGKGGQDVTFDEQGNPTLSYRADYLAQKKREGSGDALGQAIKALQFEKLQKDSEQAKKGQRLPPDKVLLVQEGASIPNMLTDIEKTIESQGKRFGPIEGRIASQNPYDTTAQTIDSQMRASSQAFGRFMEGGVLRKEDEEKYRRMFPSMSDTPQVAKNKLKVVNRLLTQKQNANLDALRAQGYDTSGFSQLAEAPLPGLLAGENGLLDAAGGLINQAPGAIVPEARADQAVSAAARQKRIAELKAKAGKK